MIRGGVTTVADAYFWETGARQALAEAGLRAVVAQGVIDFPAPGVPEATDDLRVAQDFIDSGKKSGSASHHLDAFSATPRIPAAPPPCKGPRLLPGSIICPFSFTWPRPGRRWNSSDNRPA